MVLERQQLLWIYCPKKLEIGYNNNGPNNKIRNHDAISHYIGEPIFIYYDDINHYGALIVQDGHDARNILAHLLSQPNN
jgi:hypothetical protein